jgi:5'-nucleotidase
VGKVILVDLDGVLADFDREFLSRWRERHPDEVYYELADRTTFYVHEQYGPKLHAKVRAITSEMGFFRNLPPVEDGIAVLVQLVEWGHDVVICTSPMSSTQTCHQEKFDWVLEHLGPQFARNMMIVKDKTMVRGDFLIDDRPEFKGKYEPVWEHILFHQPYNTSVQNRRRIMNWLDALEFFSEQ